MRIILYTIICSTLVEALDSEVKTYTKKEIIKIVAKDLEKRIPKGYRCSIVAGVKDD